MDREPDVGTLADAIYDVVMAANPVEASLYGDHRFARELPDISPDGVAALRSALARLRADHERLDITAMSAADRVTADVAGHVLEQLRHEADAAYLQFAAGPMPSGAAIGSAASTLLAALPKQSLTSTELAAAYRERCRAIPAHLRAAEQHLRDGVVANRVPAARLVAATARQLARYLALPADEDPLLLAGPDAQPRATGPADDAGAARHRAELAAIVAGEVRPAIARHREVLTGEIAPHGRSDEHVGLCWLPDGDRIYREAAALHTTTSTSPEELHQLGHDLIGQLADEYRRLGAGALGTGDLEEIFDRLRGDPALRFAGAGDIRDRAVAALARAQDAVGAWVATPPSIPCVVREIPAVEAPESTLAYYQPPALDGSRGGQYFVNTSDATSRSRFEAEALAFHESVPGHHTQIARAQELDLPRLQRAFYVTAFVEGWGLYAERLADEMGLYTDDLSRLGMLSFDSWRACRLVVDTGMHALGWSRARAEEFMRANSPQAHGNIANEIDRYITWPGQALAYMAGRTHIVALRGRAERLLGARFDVAAFHDAVLGHAAVPLWTLDRLVDEWIAGVRGSSAAP
ncbi:MAG TPA: DUF885 domain-containing protein [Euzebyales bacterium]|nr:DUF885 domain-containing protein [Euzebyales bacterium]